MTRLLDIVEEANRDGVPKELLFRKALEGVSKGQSAATVIETVGAFADDLRNARRVVGPGLPEDGLDDAAKALDLGVDPSVVREVARDWPHEFSFMMLVIEDLMAEGLSARRAHQLVALAEEHGYRADRLFAVSTALRRLVGAGASPAEAADTIERYLREGIPLVGTGPERLSSP